MEALTKIAPVFTPLNNPEALINHVKELTKKADPTPPNEILMQLVDQLTPIDFEAMANPNKDENFKLSNKHFLILSVEDVLSNAEKNRWGLCKNNDFIYLFNGTYWAVVEKDLFQQFLGKAAEKLGVTKYNARYYQFREQLFKQFLATAFLPRPDGGNDRVLINLQNGTFEISTTETRLRPFDRSDFLTYQLPFEYNPQAKAPMFERYLKEVLPDIESRNVIAEYLGYIFIRPSQLKLEKALLLYGTGANGKSVLFEIVNALLGQTNVSSYSLQSLTNENGYYRAKLQNLLVNYASEINGNLDTSILKQLISGEPTEARLPYGEPFTITNYAKLIFNVNELPREVEHTNAYFRRFLIVPFDVTIPEQKQDKELAKKIIESELAGVFNWVLQGLKRLLEQKGFSDCEAARLQVEKYKRQSDTVQLFIDENEYQPDPTRHELFKEIYNQYRAFCIEDGFKPLNKSNFRNRLNNIGIVVEKRNVGNVAFLIRSTAF